ncbi:collagen-binding protein [Emticicia aquatilis]|uniref:Collagen-binding protein n=1 Tax=Emticicia aquatilis TaxID=1537369 RepID=A0A916YJS9_9BACT|nr:TonB-dependent receptor [Emticicia aquatilis]GGD48174.1 collagen-binding protein [Emticicia aquatilis]
MKHSIKIIFILAIISLSVSAQNYTLSGYIKDAKSGEAVIGSSIFLTNTKSGTSANTYGFYSVTFKASDTLGVVFSSLGYQPQIKKLSGRQNQSLNIDLLENSSNLQEVVVKASRNDDNVQKTQMGVIDVPMKLANSLPVVLGERDIMKIIQLLPGVQAGNEGTTGFYVRGGNSDQNLVQLDEATVYNPNHLFGLFSTFNSNALNRVTLIKGGFPAQYGGRLSSVLDITMKEGNNKKVAVQGGIGLISSNITVEGPIKKEKGSFIISGRRTYIDLLAKPFVKGIGYTFYDLNAKINYQITPKDKLFLSGFYGNDNANYTGASSLNYGINFGNSTATLRWNHLFNQKLFANTSFIINNYHLGLSTIQSGYVAQLYSSIKDINAKTDFEFYPNQNHNVRFGVNFSTHTFAPFSASIKIPKSGKVPKFNPDSLAIKTIINELAFYFNDEIKLSSNISLNAGLRVPYFYTKDISYKYLEPRISTKINLNQETSLKLSYTVMNQFLHLIPNSTASLPTDIWIPASKATAPQQSKQISLGIFKNFKENTYKTSFEVYYKDMKNQALFKEGTLLTQVSVIENNLTFGKGYSYGAELFIEKNSGKFNGWLAYTLSWTNQTFKDLNFGKEFPFAYDRRHNLSIVGNYDLSKHWMLSGAFVFNTGRPYTLPVGRVDVGNGGTLYNGTYADYTERNNYRLNSFHRLDVSAIYKKTRQLFHKSYESEWVFSVYNLYSRRNPYFVYLSTDEITKTPVATQVSLLPAVPSVSYNFKF